MFKCLISDIKTSISYSCMVISKIILQNNSEDRPEIWCTIIDASNWYHATFFAMAQVVLFQIILVLSPTTFIAINTPKTKTLCWIQIIFSLVYVIVHIMVYGHICTGEVFKAFVVDIWSLEINDVKLKNFNFTNIPLGRTILLIVLLVKLALKFYVIIKWKLMKRKSVVREKSSSYNVLFLVFFLLLQTIVCICLVMLKNELLKSALRIILECIHRVSIHIVPIVWVIHHDSINSYACHKINQFKINQFSYVCEFSKNIMKIFSSRRFNNVINVN